MDHQETFFLTAKEVSHMYNVIRKVLWERSLMSSSHIVSGEG